MNRPTGRLCGNLPVLLLFAAPMYPQHGTNTAGTTPTVNHHPEKRARMADARAMSDIQVAICITFTTRAPVSGSSTCRQGRH
jgi:hypothetical protein